jgi:hypothetical protein
MRDCLPEIEHPATKIGMPVDLYDALAQVADDLEAGRVKHHRFPLDSSGEPNCSAIPAAGEWFSMCIWGSAKNNCGTILHRRVSR